jgi:peptide/nickel transport system permease protein
MFPLDGGRIVQALLWPRMGYARSMKIACRSGLVGAVALGFCALLWDSTMLLAIALSGALGAGITNALLSLTIVFVPPIARVAESVTTQVRGRDFVEAARASGADAFTIVRVHVLGNVLGPIFVYSTSLIAVSMILASGLSFLGLGVKPPEPEWGLMLNTLRTAIYTQPWVAALPGAMIFITSISFNTLSDGLRSAMAVKH